VKKKKGIEIVKEKKSIFKKVVIDEKGEKDRRGR